MNKMWSILLKNVQIERPHALRDPGAGHGVHLVCAERQTSSIISDEVNARTLCQRSCSTVASWVPRERRRLSRSRWRRATGPGISSPTRRRRSVTREFGADARIGRREPRDDLAA